MRQLVCAVTLCFILGIGDAVYLPKPPAETIMAFAGLKVHHLPLTGGSLQEFGDEVAGNLASGSGCTGSNNYLRYGGLFVKDGFAPFTTKGAGFGILVPVHQMLGLGAKGASIVRCDTLGQEPVVIGAKDGEVNLHQFTFVADNVDSVSLAASALPTASSSINSFLEVLQLEGSLQCSITQHFCKLVFYDVVDPLLHPVTDLAAFALPNMPQSVTAQAFSYGVNVNSNQLMVYCLISDLSGTFRLWRGVIDLTSYVERSVPPTPVWDTEIVVTATDVDVDEFAEVVYLITDNQDLVSCSMNAPVPPLNTLTVLRSVSPTTYMSLVQEILVKTSPVQHAIPPPAITISGTGFVATTSIEVVHTTRDNTQLLDAAPVPMSCTVITSSSISCTGSFKPLSKVYVRVISHNGRYSTPAPATFVLQPATAADVTGNYHHVATIGAAASVAIRDVPSGANKELTFLAAALDSLQLTAAALDTGSGAITCLQPAIDGTSVKCTPMNPIPNTDIGNDVTLQLTLNGEIVPFALGKVVAGAHLNQQQLLTTVPSLSPVVMQVVGHNLQLLDPTNDVVRVKVGAGPAMVTAVVRVGPTSFGVEVTAAVTSDVFVELETATYKTSVALKVGTVNTVVVAELGEVTSPAVTVHADDPLMLDVSFAPQLPYYFADSYLTAHTAIIGGVGVTSVSTIVGNTVPVARVTTSGIPVVGAQLRGMFAIPPGPQPAILANVVAGPPVNVVSVAILDEGGGVTALYFQLQWFAQFLPVGNLGVAVAILDTRIECSEATFVTAPTVLRCTLTGQTVGDLVGGFVQFAGRQVISNDFSITVPAVIATVPPPSPTDGVPGGGGGPTNGGPTNGSPPTGGPGDPTAPNGGLPPTNGGPPPTTGGPPPTGDPNTGPNIGPQPPIGFPTGDPCAGKQNGDSCDDGDGCTRGTTCSNGVCGRPTSTIGCFAPDPCQRASCTAQGQCVLQPVVCTAVGPCTDAVCDRATGRCNSVTRGQGCVEADAINHQASGLSAPEQLKLFSSLQQQQDAPPQLLSKALSTISNTGKLSPTQVALLLGDITPRNQGGVSVQFIANAGPALSAISTGLRAPTVSGGLIDQSLRATEAIIGGLAANPSAARDLVNGGPAELSALTALTSSVSRVWGSPAASTGQVRTSHGQFGRLLRSIQIGHSGSQRAVNVIDTGGLQVTTVVGRTAAELLHPMGRTKRVVTDECSIPITVPSDSHYPWSEGVGLQQVRFTGNPYVRLQKKSASQTPASGVFGASLFVGTEPLDVDTASGIFITVPLEGQVRSAEPACAFWSPAHSEWRTDGCEFERFGNNATASTARCFVCKCTHTTDFSVLLRGKQGDDDDSPVDMVIIYLSISSIAVAIILVALISIVLMNKKVRKVLNSRETNRAARARASSRIVVARPSSDIVFA